MRVYQPGEYHDPVLGPVDVQDAWDCGAGACGTMSTSDPTQAAIESWENFGTGTPMPEWWRTSYSDGWIQQAEGS